MTAIIDYGVGNLFSLLSSLKMIGDEAVVTSDRKIIAESDRIILPGVGAFEDAAKKLSETGLGDTVKEEVKKSKPLLGICLGMQMLFEKSYEYGEHNGLGLVKGSVKAMKGVIPEELKIPHIGWNALIFPENRERSPIFKYINEKECVYFVHSYYGTDCDDSLIASAEYGRLLTAAVQNGNVYGTQFHPEKSGETGLKILKAFTEL